MNTRQIAVVEGVTLRLDELVGALPGPVVTLIGGVHGDEPEGVLAVRRVFAVLDRETLAGSVRGVAIANPLAQAAGTRETPTDGRNLARVFPGSADGTVTERLARIITDEAIAGADLVLDLHSAGTRYAMPLLCGYAADTVVGAERAARAFAAPLTWVHAAVAAGRTLTAAQEMGIPALYVEARGGGQVRGAELDAMLDGVLRVLAEWRMVDSAPPAPGRRLVVRGGDGDLDRSPGALASGTFVTRTDVGAVVAAADILGEIFDADGRLAETVRAPSAGLVVMLRRWAPIEEGEAVALLAPVPEPW